MSTKVKHAVKVNRYDLSDDRRMATLSIDYLGTEVVHEVDIEAFEHFLTGGSGVYGCTAPQISCVNEHVNDVVINTPIELYWNETPAVIRADLWDYCVNTPQQFASICAKINLQNVCTLLQAAIKDNAARGNLLTQVINYGTANIDLGLAIAQQAYFPLPRVQKRA